MSNGYRPHDLIYITNCNEDLMKGIQLFQHEDVRNLLSMFDGPTWYAEGIYNDNVLRIKELQRRLSDIPTEITYSTDYMEINDLASPHGDIARTINLGWMRLDELITPEVLQTYWERLETINKRMNETAPDESNLVMPNETPYKNFQQGWAHWNLASWKDKPAYNLYMCDCFFKNVEYIIELREK